MKRVRHAASAIALASLWQLACAPVDRASEDLGESESALTSAQCDYFNVNGNTQVCHATSSTKHPYTILKISAAACGSAHAAHPGDYVAVNDPSCGGGGCLPEAAPCDATLPCCEGTVCTAGK